MSGAFPRSLNFQPDPLAISARAYYSISVPEGTSTANPSSIVRLRVPVSRAGTFLNPHKTFLAFDVVNATSGSTDGANADERGKQLSPIYLDGSAYAVIDRLECYNSSNLLESIDAYGVLANIFLDLQVSQSARKTASTILGTGPSGCCDPLYQALRGASAYDGMNNGSKQTGSGAADQLYPEYASYSLTTAGGAVANTTNQPIKGMYFAGMNLLPRSYFVATGGNNSKLSVSASATTFSTDNPNLTVGGIGTADNDVNTAFGVVYLGPVRPDRPNSVCMRTGVIGVATVQAPTALELGAYYSANQGANNIMGITRLGPCIPFNGRTRFCLPLISGVIGTLACRLIPICQLNSDILVNIYTASNENAICLGATPTHINTATGTGASPSIVNPAQVAISTTLYPRQYRLERIELNCAICEVSSAAMNAIDSATSGVFTIPTSSYRHYATSLQGGSTHHEFLVPARFTSLKGLLGCMRPSSVADGGGESTQNFTLTNRIKNWMTSLQYRVGSVLVPQEPIRMENTYYSPFGSNQATAQNGRAPEAFSHILSVVGQSVSDLDLECCLNDSIYGNNVPTSLLSIQGEALQYEAGATPASVNAVNDGRFYKAVAEGSQSGFVFGIDLESFSTSHCSSPIQCGTNTLGLNIFCILKSNLSLTANQGSANVPSTNLTARGIGDTGATFGLGGSYLANNANTILPVICDHFAHYDMILSVAGGIMSSRF